MTQSPPTSSEDAVAQQPTVAGPGAAGAAALGGEDSVGAEQGGAEQGGAAGDSPGDGPAVSGQDELPGYRPAAEGEGASRIEEDRSDAPLQAALRRWRAAVKVPSSVRVAIDIDPQSFL